MDDKGLTFPDAGVIDCCMYSRPNSEDELMPFLSEGWREYLGRPANTHEDPAQDGKRKASRSSMRYATGGSAMLPARIHSNPEGERLALATKSVTSAGDEQDIRRDYLDRHSVRRAVVIPEPALLVPLIGNHNFAVGIARAINDWSLANSFGAQAGRLFGVIATANQLPDSAADEIRRVGSNDGFVGVLMAGNGLSKPFGHPLYHPIYAAAVELGLPIIIHVGGDAPPSTLSYPTGGGLAATYVEYYVLRSHSVMTHVTSMIGQGVFDKFPTLRLLIIGAGLNWLPSFLWRFDAEYQALGGSDAPWMTRRPTEYFVDHVRITTYSVSEVTLSDSAIRALATLGWIEDVVCFASGFPNWDVNEPDWVARRIPESWRSKIMSENARTWLRWDAS
jgi:predicted TIM-barrel fold metal-dependent hydrolase